MIVTSTVLLRVSGCPLSVATTVKVYVVFCEEEKCSYKLSTHVTVLFSYLCSNNSWEELLIADGAILVNGEVKVRVIPDAVEDLVVKTIFVSGFHLQERGACWRGRRGEDAHFSGVVYQV